MNDTCPEIEALRTARFTAMSGDPSLSDYQRRREPCRRFHADALARAVFPEPEQ